MRRAPPRTVTPGRSAIGSEPLVGAADVHHEQVALARELERRAMRWRVPDAPATMARAHASSAAGEAASKRGWRGERPTRAPSREDGWRATAPASLRSSWTTHRAACSSLDRERPRRPPGRYRRLWVAHAIERGERRPFRTRVGPIGVMKETRPTLVGKTQRRDRSLLSLRTEPAKKFSGEGSTSRAHNSRLARGGQAQQGGGLAGKNTKPP